MTDSNFVFYIFTFLFALIVTAMLERRLIPLLKSKAEQPIYDEGPVWHLKKKGTPTMGGLGFLISACAVLLISVLYLYLNEEAYFATSLLITTCYAALNAAIGAADDYAKIRKKENAGLSPLQKLILQSAAASVFIMARRILLFSSTEIVFKNASVDLGIFYYPLTLVMLVATVNCANLTDGIDGIASGVSFAIGIALAYLSFNSSYEVAFISFALMGAAVGFLVFNLHPAKIFMGDTGSLFLGSLAAAACCSLGNPLIILLVGVVYLLEGLSVIIQVLFFKMTKKRIFKMAPLHHHLEKCGWPENKIVIWAIILTLVFSIPIGLIFV